MLMSPDQQLHENSFTVVILLTSNNLFLSSSSRLKMIILFQTKSEVKC